MNWSPDLFGIATIFATFFGPIFAVVATRMIDSRREQRDRQKAIFRALMSTRAARLNADAIQALNLLEIEFWKNKSVIQAWHSYFENLQIESPKDQANAVDFFNKRNHLYVILLERIAKTLGYKFDQLSILGGGYNPNAAVQIEADNQAVRQLFADIARGERSLSIRIENLPIQD